MLLYGLAGAAFSQNQAEPDKLYKNDLEKKAGGVLLDKVLAERIEIACRESVSYCLIPPLFKDTEFYTFFLNRRAASKYLGDQFCLLLETICWA